MRTENCKYFTCSQVCYSEHIYLSGISLLLFSNVNFVCNAGGRVRGQQAVIVRPVCLVSVDLIFQRPIMPYTHCVQVGCSMTHCHMLVM